MISLMKGNAAAIAIDPARFSPFIRNKGGKSPFIARPPACPVFRLRTANTLFSGKK
jgi:hypothetical protein